MFTVVMPVWNRAHIVGRAIASVLKQTYGDFELLVMDDGSTDAIESAIKPFLSDGRVRLIRGRRQGVAGARNAALREARGEHIAYLDSDNVWHENFLERMRDVISAGDCDAAYCQARFLTRDGKTGEVRQTRTLGAEFNFKNLLGGNYIDLNTLVHARRVLDHTGMFDTEMKRLSDWDLIIRIAAKFEMRFVAETLVDYYYCVEGNAISANEDFERYDRLIKRRYPALEEPITAQHDMITYSWDSLPDRKYRNYWLKTRLPQINRVDYKPYGYPFMMQVEPTTMCNLRCPLCPVAQGTLRRPARHMRLEEFKRVVDDMADYLMILVMWDWGEPLMNPELPAMVRYATERDIRTVTSTNGHFLGDKRYVEELLSAGLSTLIVAIDSADAAHYQKYRKGGHLDKALAGLQNVIDVKRRLGAQTIINFRMVIMRQNEKEVGKMKRLAKKMGADVFTAKTVNPACGEVGLDSEMVPVRKRYQRLEYKPGSWERVRVNEDCQRVWMMSNVFADGGVVPCCYDFDGMMKVGNAFAESFREIWRGEAYAAMRKRVLESRDELVRCTQCLVNYKHTPHGMFYWSTDLHKNGSLGRRIMRTAKRLLEAAMR